MVIATHPHGDHSAGLESVLKEMQVNEFWMHRPWDETHINNISHWFTDGRVTNKGIRDALRKSLDIARELEKIAQQKGVTIVEPFVGIYKDFGCGQIAIAGPTKEYYESLLPDFTSTPESKSLVTKAYQGIKEVVGKVFENWGYESLDDTGETSSENNSSVITLLTVEGKYLLFTGDAGIPALTHAANLLKENSISNESFSFIQVPHHGSKRNVGPAILNRLVGPKLPEEQKETEKMEVFCSCAVIGEPKHPSKKVTNAFRRRGAHVYVTQGRTICNHSKNVPQRPGWGRAVSLDFYTEIEEDE